MTQRVLQLNPSANAPRMAGTFTLSGASVVPLAPLVSTLEESEHGEHFLHPSQEASTTAARAAFGVQAQCKKALTCTGGRRHTTEYAPTRQLFTTRVAFCHWPVISREIIRPSACILQESFYGLRGRGLFRGSGVPA